MLNICPKINASLPLASYIHNVLYKLFFLSHSNCIYMLIVLVYILHKLYMHGSLNYNWNYINATSLALNWHKYDRFRIELANLKSIWLNWHKYNRFKTFFIISPLKFERGYFIDNYCNKKNHFIKKVINVLHYIEKRPSYNALSHMLEDMYASIMLICFCK